MVTVSVVSEVDGQLVEAVGRLLPQLSSSAPALNAEEIAQVIACPATYLLIAWDGGQIVGMLTLAVFRIPTGMRGWVEDVVVDSASRGRGVGDQLVKTAVELAQAKGAKTVDLTSRPSREAANRLYQRAGFEQRQTNVYRFKAQS